MKKKLVKHGNSLALIIEKPILEMLNINEKTSLDIVMENNKLIIKIEEKSDKNNLKKNDAQIDAIAEKIMDKYADVFKKLAKE